MWSVFCITNRSKFGAQIKKQVFSTSTWKQIFALLSIILDLAVTLRYDILNLFFGQHSSPNLGWKWYCSNLHFLVTSLFQTPISCSHLVHQIDTTAPLEPVIYFDCYDFPKLMWSSVEKVVHLSVWPLLSVFFSFHPNPTAFYQHFMNKVQLFDFPHKILYLAGGIHT